VHLVGLTIITAGICFKNAGGYSRVEKSCIIESRKTRYERDIRSTQEEEMLNAKVKGKASLSPP